MKVCTLCGLGVSADLFETHSKDCLKKKFSWVAAKETIHNKEEMEGYHEKEEVCSLCNQMLTNLSAVEKIQHRNSCADQLADEKIWEKKKTKALNLAQNVVLDCPVCGQAFKTKKGRQAHMKRCAAKHQVGSDVLLERIHQQEEEYKQRLEAGYLPPDLLQEKPEKKQAKKKRTVRKNPPVKGVPGASSVVQKTLTGAQCAVHGMERKFEEDVQVALALSMSMNEQRHGGAVSETIKPTTPIKRGDTRNVNGTKLDKDAFSLLMTQRKEVARKGRRKIKICLEKLPLLTQSEQEINSKLVDKISGVILSQTRKETCHVTPTFSLSKVGRKYKQKSNGDKEVPSCWHRTVMHDSLLSPDTCDVFYVTQLMPPITKCTVAAGSKVKNLATIPGWNSFREPQSITKKRVSTVKMNDHNETIDAPASTQTAALLAELAQEHGTTVIHDVNTITMLNQTLFTEEPSGFLNVEKDPLDTIPALRDYESMVNSELLSDVTISVAKGKKIPAHKFVLAARCKLLLKFIQNDELDFTGFKKDAVLVVLRYLYTGCAEVPKAVALDVENMAELYKIEALKELCERVIAEHNLNPVPEETQSSNLNPDVTLQRMLKDAWGSSDEDSLSSAGSDSESETKDGGNPQQKIDDQEMEMLYSFMATQRSHGQTDNLIHSEESSEGVVCGDITKQPGDLIDSDDSSEGRVCDNVTKQPGGGGFVFSLVNKTFNETMSQGSVDRLKHLSDSEVLERLHSGSDVMFLHELSQVLTDGADSESEKSSSSSVIFSENDSDSDTCLRQVDSDTCVTEKNITNKRPSITVKDSENLDQTKSNFRSDLSSNSRNTGSQVQSKNIIGGSFVSFHKSNAGDSSPEILSDNVNMVVCDNDEINEMHQDDSVSSCTDSERDVQSSCFKQQVSCSAASDNIDSYINEEAENNSNESDYSSCISDKNYTKPKISFSGSESEVHDCSNTISKRAESESPMLFLNSQPRDSNNTSVNSYDRSELDGSCTELFESFRDKNSFLQNTGESVNSCCDENNPDTDVSDSKLNTAIDVSVSSTPSPIFHSQKDSSNQEHMQKNPVLLNNSQSRRSLNTNFKSCSVISLSPDSINLNKKRKRETENSGSGIDGEDLFEVKHRKTLQLDNDVEDDVNVGDALVLQDKVSKPQNPANCAGKSISRSPQSRHAHKAVNAENNIKRSLFIDTDKASHEICKSNNELCGRSDEKHHGKDDLIDLTAGSGNELEENPIPGHEDVWEDFEDDGVLLDYVEDIHPSQTSLGQEDTDVPSSPEIQSSRKPESRLNISPARSKKQMTECTVNKELSTSVKHPAVSDLTQEDVEDIDPPTDMSTNVSGFLDLSDVCVTEGKQCGTKNMFRTPKAVAASKKSLSEWVPPSPYTPELQYEAIATPQLLKQCKTYGLRNMPKKKMVHVLKHIYSETHDYETDPEFDHDAAEKARAQYIPDDVPQTKAKSQQAKPKRKKPSVNSLKPSTQTTTVSSTDKIQPARAKPKQSAKVPLHNISVTEESDSGESSARSFLAEESVLHEDEPKLSKRDVQYKRKQLWELITSNEDLQLKILHYEPVDIDDFQKLIKDAKMNIGTSVVKDFLDEKSIPFSLRNQNKASYGRKGKKKKNP